MKAVFLAAVVTVGCVDLARPSVLSGVDAAAAADRLVDRRVDQSFDQAVDSPRPPDGGACAPSATLIGHWSFDETSGTMASDSSCQGNVGTLRGYVTPDWRSGKVRGALGFDGVDDWVLVPSAGGINQTAMRGELTIAAWVFTTALPRSEHHMVLSRQSAAVPLQEHYALYRRYNTGRLGVQLNSWEPTPAICLDPGDFPLGVWVHVAATYDRATLRLFRNGVEVCTRPQAVTLMSDSRPVIIGANMNNPTGDPQRYWNGLLDEVLLYARALSANEIAALAQGAAPPRD